MSRSLHRKGVRRIANRIESGGGGLFTGTGQLGPLARSAGRPLRPQDDAPAGRGAFRAGVPDRRIAGSIEVLIGGRVIGGVSAGMAYPTTLALIAALWSGQARTKAIALWSATGGAIAACGPVVAGFLLEHFSWRSVFVVTLPLAVVALVMAWKFVPAHVNETTERVDNLGGILSMVLVGALILGINFAPVPNETALVVSLFAISIVATGLFLYRQRKAANPLYDLKVASRRVFWVAAVAGIVVFGSLMGAMFIGQQFLQNVLDYSTLRSRIVDLACRPRDDRGCPAIGQAGRVARFADHVAHRLRLCAGGLRDDAPALERGISYWKVGLGYALVGVGVGFAGTPASHSLTGSVPVTRAGMASGTADLQRDLGGAIMQSIFGALADRWIRGRGCHLDRGGAQWRSGYGERRKPAAKIILECRGSCRAIPGVFDRDHCRRQAIVPRWRSKRLSRRHRRRAHRWGPGLLHVPEEG